MAVNFIAKAQVIIEANREQVWEALTAPSMIKEYLFGTEAHSEWKEGSKVEFRGQSGGKPYCDKGEVLRFEPPALLQYTYFSEQSGLDDAPENYMNITYELNEKNASTLLTVKQENNPDEASQKKAQEMWENAVKKLKAIVERQSMHAEPGRS